MVEVSQPRVPDYNGDHSALSESMRDYSGCKNVCIQAADQRVKVVPWSLYVDGLILTSLCLICSDFAGSFFGEELVKINDDFVFYWFLFHFFGFFEFWGWLLRARLDLGFYSVLRF